MITLASFLTILGFFMFYSTSKRAALQFKIPLQQWANQHPKPAKCLFFTLTLIAYFICVAVLGWGGGSFSFLVILMTAGSLIVLLSPLKFFNLFTLIPIGVVSLLIEIYLTYNASK